MAYLLDADVFIRAKNLHYGLDFCSAFWDWLIDRNAAGIVFSIEEVGDEVQVIEDDLSKWAAALGPGAKGCQRHSLVFIPGARVLATMRTEGHCKVLVSELARLWVRWGGSEPAEDPGPVLDRHGEKTSKTAAGQSSGGWSVLP
ncbi:MAG TPA: DUF4411 family protein [Thermoanaerobaculia bacterium]|jgi:hypothetical protein|nr:DUF4411 family protein [Thermoanaerobaculia bacterium]